MKIRIPGFLLVPLFIILFAGCNDSKQSNTDAKENPSQGDLKTDKQASANDISLQAPDFADPELKRYYGVYTGYLKKVVIAIRNKDEAGTMKLFLEEGKQFDNRNEMDQKAKTEDEQKFTTWLLQSMPIQTEIIRSDYYKKFNEEYYKKVKEKAEAMDKK
jgi:hypothetical protein